MRSELHFTGYFLFKLIPRVFWFKFRSSLNPDVELQVVVLGGTMAYIYM